MVVGEDNEVDDSVDEVEGVCVAWAVIEEFTPVIVGEEVDVRDNLDPDGVKVPVLVKL